MIENPILVFRNSQGWSRTELSRKTGISFQVLRDLEIGFTKRMSARTLESLGYVGIDEDIQKKLDDWHEYQNEQRKNVMLKEKGNQNTAQIEPEPLLVDADQVLVNKPTKKASRNRQEDKTNE